MLLILLILTCFSTSSELFLIMENRKQYCFYKTLNQTENLGITYIVSGSGQKNVQFKIQEIVSSVKIDTIFTQNEVSEFHYLFTPRKEKQEIKICFENTDSNVKNLQFDFALETEKNKNLATKSDMAGLLLELKRGQRKLQKMYQNQQFQSMRDETHSKKMVQTEYKVKLASIIKIVVLILICVVQIVVLTGFFKTKYSGNV